MYDVDRFGKVTESRPKDVSSKEIDGDGRFAGHRFLLKTHLYGDKRCIYCGKWFHWKDSDYFQWVNEKNIDIMNTDGNVEPLHCGSSHCHEFHRRWLIHKEKVRQREAENRERLFIDLFKNLKKQGLVK